MEADDGEATSASESLRVQSASLHRYSPVDFQRGGKEDDTAAAAANNKAKSEDIIACDNLPK